MPTAEDFLADTGTQSAEDFLGKEEAAPTEPSRGFFSDLFWKPTPGKEVPLPTLDLPPGIRPPTKADLERAELATQGKEVLPGGATMTWMAPGTMSQVLPTFQAPKEAGPVEKVATGAYNTLAGIPNFFSGPEGWATAIAPAALPKSLAGPALKGVFSMLLAKTAGEQAGEATAGVRPGMTIPEALKTIDPQQLTEAGGAAVMAGLTHLAPEPKGPTYARSQQEAAAIHGDVRPQPQQGAGQVPAQESGGRVLASPEAMAQAAQIPLDQVEAMVRRGEPLSQLQQLRLDMAQSIAHPTVPAGRVEAAPRAKIGGGSYSGRKTFWIDYGGKREFGFETEAEAKMVAEQIERGERPMEGEEIPLGALEAEQEMGGGEEEVAGATFTNPETGETTAGPHHPAAAAEQGVDATGPRESREGPEFGFVTTMGKKLTRAAAEKKAEQTGQKLAEPKTGAMHSDETKGPGSDKPMAEMSQLELAVGTEASKVGRKAEVLNNPPTPDETVPFAANVAYITKDGRLVFNRRNLEAQLAKLPQSQHAAYIERVVNEEHLHGHTTDEDALAYLKNSSAPEFQLAVKQYTGFNTLEEAAAAGHKFTPTQIGKEMIRQRLQQLSGLGVREIVELSGREKWNARFIDALQRIIFNIRKAIGTKASKVRVQQDILNRMQGNLDAVKGGGETAGTFYKRGAGEKGPRDIESMDDAAARKYFADLKGKGVGTQYDSVVAGMKLSDADLPDLRRLHEESGRNMMAALEKGDQKAFEAQFGKNVWYAGAIEGARRSGPNYESLQQESAKREFPGLPKVEPGTVRLYHGEGGPEGAGMYSQWFSEDPRRASSYGGHVTYVDIPESVAQYTRQMAKKAGSGTGTDHFLPDEWIMRAQPVKGAEMPVHEIAGAFKKPERDEEAQAWVDLDHLYINGVRHEGRDNPTVEAAKMIALHGYDQALKSTEKIIADQQARKGTGASQQILNWATPLRDQIVKLKDADITSYFETSFPGAFKKESKWTPGAKESGSRRPEDFFEIDTPEKFRTAVLKEAEKEQRAKALMPELRRYLDALVKRQPIGPEMQMGKQLAQEISMNRLGIVPTDPGELAGAFKKESKQQREARQARERATESLPGFGGPAPSEVKLQGEVVPPQEKPQERIGAAEAGAGLPPDLIEQRQREAEGVAVDYVAAADTPNFEDFSRKMEQFHFMDRNQAALMFENKLWDHLVSARGARLEQLVRSLGLEGQVFAREARKKGAVASRAPSLMPEAGVKSIIPDNAQQEQFKLVQEVAGGAKFNRDELEAIRKRRVAQQRFRSRVVGVIARKLASQIVGPESNVARKDFTIEDIDWSNPDRVAGPFEPISEADAKKPGFMQRLFSADARRSSDDPVSYTKRLMVLVNKNTGEVQIASAYPHGRSGLMVMRGAVAGLGERHIKFTDLPTHEKPIYTILLKDPVHNFLKRFKNLTDFNQYVSIEDATARNTASEFTEPGGEGRKVPVLESESEPGALKGGMFAGGPGGQEVAGLFRSTPGEILGRAARSPMEAREVRSLLKLADQFEVSEPKDLEEMVKAIEQAARERQGIRGNVLGALRGSHAAAISAIVKAAAVDFKEATQAWVEQKEEARKAGQKFDFPAPSEKQAYANALNTLFNLLTKNEGVEDYVQRTLERYRREADEVSATAAPTLQQLLSRPREAAGVERELTMRQPPPRMPPTRFPSPRTAEEPLPPGAEKLPPEAVPGVEARAVREFPYTPTGEAGVTAPPTGRILKYSAPGFRTRSGLLGPRESEGVAGAFFKNPKDAAERELNKMGRGIVAAVQRGHMEDMIAATRDAANNNSNNEARRQENYIRMTAKNDRERLGGAIALVQAGFDPNKLPEFVQKVTRGIAAARDMAQNGPTWFDRLKGKQWLKSNRDLMKELGYAGTHWDDPELQATARALKNVLDNQYGREVAAGSNIRYNDAYVPGRYEAELFNDDSVVFGALHDLLGRNWKAPKTFPSYYDAAEAGPYIPVSRDAADIAGHRVRQGLNSINFKGWAQTLKNYIDPVSGSPAAENAIRRPDGSYSPTSPEHVLWYPTPGGTPLSIRRGIEPLIRNLTSFSSVQNNLLGRNALELSQRLKHTLLIGDFFHLGRVSYYAASLLNPIRANFTKGLAAIEYRPQDLPESVRQGLISQKSADWATERVPVNLGGGRTVMMSRIEIADLGQRMGLNNGRIRDALYSNLVVNALTEAIPGVRQTARGIAKYNKWLFDKVTRGFITQSFVHQFEALNKAHPDIDSRTLARDVARDINNYFGNIGRQGWIKSQTWQDMARMAFLAPQWVEGLVQKEAGLYTRVAGAPFGYRKGLPKLGALGKGMGAGLVTMLAATQALNLIFRGKPTWENEEKGHKWDAFVFPDHEGNGLWFSPLAVFNELSHDVWRLYETKAKTWDIITQIGMNKLSPYGRAALVGVRSMTPTGQYLTTTGGVGKEMAKQLAPVPITAARPLQALGHAVAPGLVPPTQRGQLPRQFAAVAGLKMEPSTSPAQQMQAKAEQFLLDNPELKKSTGWMEVQTDEPNYTKLRSAIRNGDDATAKREFEALKKSRTDDQIVKAMRLSSNRPFTGSRVNETKFLYSLKPQEMDAYFRALVQKQEEYTKFIEWFVRQAEAPTSP